MIQADAITGEASQALTNRALTAGGDFFSTHGANTAPPSGSGGALSNVAALTNLLQPAANSLMSRLTTQVQHSTGASSKTGSSANRHSGSGAAGNGNSGTTLTGHHCLHLSHKLNGSTNQSSSLSGASSRDRDRRGLSPGGLPGPGSNSVPAHPAGACLEALLSFFLSAVPNDLALLSAAACRALGRSMTTALCSVSQVLIQGLSVDSNGLDFESVVRGSQIITLVSEVLRASEFAL